MGNDYDFYVNAAQRWAGSMRAEKDEASAAIVNSNLAIADRLDRLCRILSSKRD